MLDRINSIESELTRLTAKTEQLEFRINQVVQDGTNRVGDLEFRICELDANCDIATLAETPPLGGQVPTAVSPAFGGPQQTADTPQMAVGEIADFDRAKAALDSGDYASAIQQFDAFGQAYPGGPLSGQASLLKGQAFEATGQMASAARAYLNAFSSNPSGQEAPEALTKLGVALGALGQQQEACVTLGEVGIRFPNHEQVPLAQTEMRNLGCS